jgi:hypothetical protein
MLGIHFSILSLRTSANFNGRHGFQNVSAVHTFQYLGWKREVKVKLVVPVLN